ncbi:MAG: A/G-specific adenine glycosylase [Azoarcus sp.]|nr:A/G-specific adenine glycosylase [Azoarcus sp.]
MTAFAPRLIAWQAAHGRHGLPWQASRDPYRIWLSEVMLQQTQVATVTPYYIRFLARFPDVAALAAAPLEDVMALWSGLGYYARARNLHRAARQVMEKHGGRFPAARAELAELPGIGRSTAAAIAAFANQERAAILDGNVKRVLCRVFGIEGPPGEKATETRLWALAESLLPDDGKDIGAYIQAQMDLGATLCTRGHPQCAACPLADECVARREGRVAELPTPRPRKILPRRRQRFAVLMLDDKVLLERRPPVGLWGGLLGLLEIPPDVGIARWAERFGLDCGQPELLPALTHTFTHFILELESWRIPLRAFPRMLAEPTHEWLALDRIESAALPTAVRKILTALAGTVMQKV